MARELGTAIAAAADAIESTRRIPAPMLARLHASRLLRMLLPRTAGGDQTEPGTYVLAVEEIARHDASVAWNVFVANSSALIAAFLDQAVARAIFGDAPTILAWGHPTPRGRRRCGAIASAAHDSPAVAAMRTGWARTATWSRPMARSASITSADRQSAHSCFRRSRRL
jgi:alkylation response protein AidB-like acyl-CoA dehydrogenase